MEVSSKRQQAGSSHRGSNTLKDPKQKGLMDCYFTPDPKAVVQKRKGQQMRLDINTAAKKELRDRACQQAARWFYDAGIPFNAAKYESFVAIIEAIGQYGPGMKPPNYHELRVPLLKKEVETTREAINDHEQVWEKNGCSIMTDGWQDKRERTLINFLVNCPKRSMFVVSVDASSYSKIGEKIFELHMNFMEKIGLSKVVQVVTDSASSNVLAGKILLNL